MTPSLHVVTSHEAAYRVMTERRAREMRIDALGVDRSHLAQGPIPRWSAEALERGERTRQADRADVTAQDRLDAYRAICALPQVTR